MQSVKYILAVLYAGILTVSLTGCEKDGPMEKAGENIDKSVESAGDKIEETADKAEDKLDR